MHDHPLLQAASPELMARAKKVKLVLFDVDGVLTDGRLYLDNHGEEYKAFNSRDGHGLKMLQRNGVEVGIITGRTSEIVTHRTKELGIRHVRQGCADKFPVYEDMLRELKLGDEQVGFVGDDIVDLPIMLRAGLAVCPQDGHFLVKRHSHWVSPSDGGRGCARDVCELLMLANGSFGAEMQRYY
jgi:3-deoxy-D-manno-octulosonate 8-phosphate phosphatase (KDO 8-P phosphatase)